MRTDNLTHGKKNTRTSCRQSFLEQENTCRDVRELPNLLSEEIAEEMDLDCQKVRWMLRVSHRPYSLEKPVGEDEDSELGSFIEDRRSPSPTDLATENMLKERMEELLNTLSPREARILRLRFGLDNGRAYTLEEIGRKFGLTRERIRQIQMEALRKLRHPSRSRRLKGYLS